MTISIMQNIWTLVKKTHELNSMEAALNALKPTRWQCDIVNGQRLTVYSRAREAIEMCQFGQKLSQGTTVTHPEFGKVHVSLSSDDDFHYFLNGLPSQGEDVCRQLVADPESMLPGKGNWSLFEPESWRGNQYWVPKTDEDFFLPLEEYYIENFIRPLDPDYEDSYEAYYELPMDGFLSLPPDLIGSKKQQQEQKKRYLEYIRVMTSEKTAQEYYKQLDQQMIQQMVQA